MLLPPANEVCEGYVVTGVCLSRGGGLCRGGKSLSRGGLCPGGSLSREDLCPGGLCPGGNRSLSGGGGSLSRRPTPVMVTCGWYAICSSIGRMDTELRVMITRSELFPV